MDRILKLAAVGGAVAVLGACAPGYGAPHAGHKAPVYGGHYAAPAVSHHAAPAVVTSYGGANGYSYNVAAAPVAAHATQYAPRHAAPHPAPYAAVPGALRGPQAERGYLYGELGAVTFDPIDSAWGAQGRLGFQANRYLGGELEGSIGVTDVDNGSGSIAGFSADGKVEYTAAAFLRGRLPVADKLALLGRVGYHTTKFGVDIEGPNGFRDSMSETVGGIAYGFGAEYALGPRSAIRADYTEYDVDELFDLDAGANDAGSITYVRRF